MKLGIITNYNKNTVNFGNVLQTFALNYYLRTNYSEIDVETVFLHDDFNIGKVKTSYFVALIRKIVNIFNPKKEEAQKKINKNRQSKFLKFSLDNIVLSDEIFDEAALKNKYDILVVGSDVVWSQIRNNYNRVKFLNFSGAEKAIKFSYAASFGKNYIPWENRYVIKKALKNFQGIGVRENAAVNLLKRIGVGNAVHVLDPTFLPSAKVWTELERIPQNDFFKDTGNYIFCFMLNPKEWQLDFMKRIKKCYGYKCVCVSNGYEVDANDKKDIYDLFLEEIGPDEWLWIIHHAQYVTTDSFHCLAFSNIYNVPFYVLERDYSSDINDRMKDFLQLTHNEDKFIYRDNVQKVDFESDSWDYVTTNKLIEEKLISSKAYIESMLRY